MRQQQSSHSQRINEIKKLIKEPFLLLSIVVIFYLLIIFLIFKIYQVFKNSLYVGGRFIFDNYIYFFIK